MPRFDANIFLTPFLRHRGDQDSALPAKHVAPAQQKLSADQRGRRGVQLVAGGRLAQPAHAQFPESGKKPFPVPVLTGKPPDILRGAGVALDGAIAHRAELFFQRETALRQHPHRTERDREKPDPSPEQLPVALAQVLA